MLRSSTPDPIDSRLPTTDEGDRCELIDKEINPYNLNLPFPVDSQCPFKIVYKPKSSPENYQTVVQQFANPNSSVLDHQKPSKIDG